MNQFDQALAIVGKQRLLEEYRAEIERAIRSVKRSDLDQWFRRMWYRAAATSKQPKRASDSRRWFE
jgi:hypothetical protein